MIPGSEDNPARIAQQWLDDVSDTFFNGDFDGFAAAVALPFVMSTQNSRTVLNSREDLRAGYDAWVQMIEGHHATHLIRTVREVQRVNPDMITTTYDTELLRHAARLMPGFTSWMMLRRVDGCWKADHLVSGIVNARYPFNVLQVDPEAPVPLPDRIPDPEEGQ